MAQSCFSRWERFHGQQAPSSNGQHYQYSSRELESYKQLSLALSRSLSLSHQSDSRQNRPLLCIESNIRKRFGILATRMYIPLSCRVRYLYCRSTSNQVK